MVRAKFFVASVTDMANQPGSTEVMQRDVLLRAVSGEQNKAWSKWTPYGELKMSITNPEAFKQFEPGKTFYVDFSDAPATEPG